MLEDAQIGMRYAEHNARQTNEPISLGGLQRQIAYPLPISHDMHFLLADYSRYLRGRVVEMERTYAQDDRPLITVMQACYAWIGDAMQGAETLDDARKVFYARLENARYSDQGLSMFLDETGLGDMASPDYVTPNDVRIRNDEQFAFLMTTFFSFIAHDFFNHAGGYDPERRISQNPQVRAALKL
ncbi:MAG: hypothetical protein KDJ49_08095 [Alphaproteobacteria bacterium]|nr:hypothetical protein [Alphaproteobacteria bacterium]USO07636.1 MAG: hypothetical protein H6866_09570 [Rhodospirillales bacterium]